MERGCMLFVLVLLTASYLVDGQAGSCPQGRFGDSCSYSCNCDTSCHSTTGVCTGDCDVGWREGNGSSCQKKNVAYRKPVSGSGDWGRWSAEKAVDGNRDKNILHNSCYHSTYYPSFWWVDLAAEYRIHSVRIYKRAGYPQRWANCTISVGPDSNSETVCYTFPSNPNDISDITDLTCNGTGRFFIIRNPGEAPQRDDALSICEVEIYVCSEGTFGLNCSEFCHCLNSTCDHVTGRCPGDCRPGWKGDSCSKGCSYSESYGINCNRSCSDRKCNSKSSSCDRRNGSCDGGCRAGWRKSDCTKKCDSLYYGNNCSRKCEDRRCALKTSSCNHVTGACDTGACQAGWKGDSCTEQCDNGKYGPNCLKKCSDRHCNGTSSCPRVNGSCSSGCDKGWERPDCSGCQPGTFGPDCTRCGHCDVPCNVEDGRCPGKCLDGFTGDRCDVNVRGVSGILSPVTSGAIGGAVAVVVMLLLVGGLMICLLKSGRLKWISSSTQVMRNTDTGGTGEIPAYANTSGTNDQDYTELDVVTREREEKSPYDVIQNRVYENNQI